MWTRVFRFNFRIYSSQRPPVDEVYMYLYIGLPIAPPGESHVFQYLGKITYATPSLVYESCIAADHISSIS